MNEYMILCKKPFVTFEYWQDIFQDIRNRKDNKTFGYGTRVETKHYELLENIRKDLPFRDHFFFLISNKKNREFPIHVDGVPNQKNAASVNWPLQNCDDHSPTTWYSCENPEYLDLDNSFFLKNVEDAIPIHQDTMYSDKKLPYLFRSDLLHKGYCNMQESGLRIILKWELDYDDWQTACTEFRNRDYI